MLFRSDLGPNGGYSSLLLGWYQVILHASRNHAFPGHHSSHSGLGKTSFEATILRVWDLGKMISTNPLSQSDEMGVGLFSAGFRCPSSD
jgi:hypothetical protein